jgi:hypothetical protein
MRPAGTLSEGEIASTAAATTAHTTSIHPTLNANMRPHAATAERTSEPGAQDEPQRNQPLTKAIRELVGTQPKSGVDDDVLLGKLLCFLSLGPSVPFDKTRRKPVA